MGMTMLVNPNNLSPCKLYKNFSVLFWRFLNYTICPWSIDIFFLNLLVTVNNIYTINEYEIEGISGEFHIQQFISKFNGSWANLYFLGNVSKIKYELSIILFIHWFICYSKHCFATNRSDFQSIASKTKP